MSRGFGLCANLLCAGAAAAVCFQLCAPSPVVVVQQQQPLSSSTTTTTTTTGETAGEPTTSAPLPLLMMVRP